MVAPMMFASTARDSFLFAVFEVLRKDPAGHERVASRAVEPGGLRQVSRPPTAADFFHA